VAKIDYSNTDGFEVIWHLLTTEPFFWVILSIGFIAILASWWIDKLDNSNSNEHIKHYDDSHHMHR
jgi:hypothetical protein